MKVKVPLLLLLVLAAAAGYMFGTESGRAQREIILIKLGKGPQDDSEGDGDAAESSDDGSTASAD